MSDAIIVLGRGINKDGSLPADPQSRVKKAMELFNTGDSSRIVMSGAWSFHLDDEPEQSEAALMKNYAVSLGVPEQAIIEESESKDTIGNVYFSKKNIVEPRNWKTLTIIASDDHMPRVQYLFHKIYGNAYKFNFIESKRVLDDKAYSKEIAHESESLKTTKQWLDSVADGDDNAIWEIVLKQHPAYKK